MNKFYYLKFRRSKLETSEPYKSKPELKQLYWFKLCRSPLKIARHQWLMPVILVLRRQRSGGLQFKVSQGKYFVRPYLEKNHHTKGVVEWLKV
jgi:hypothetical protein